MTRWSSCSALLGVVLALMLGACGGDDDDETAAETGASVPTIGEVTNPAATATQAPTPPATPTRPAGPEPTPAAPTAEPNACETDEAISQLSFEGLPCAEAAAVADEWNRMQDACNTIDDPNSPEGFNRTCTVQSYTCRAKRDVRSDARFVACAKGSAQVRFTWAPA